MQQRWPTDLLRRVDEARGRATRTEFTLRALEAALDGPAQPLPGRLTRAEIDSRALPVDPGRTTFPHPTDARRQQDAAPKIDQRTMMLSARQQRLNDAKQRETDRRRRSGG